MKRRELFIDLTSLLDVILIILFLVIMSVNTKAHAEAAKTEQQKESYEKIISEKDSEISSLSKNLEISENNARNLREDIRSYKTSSNWDINEIRTFNTVMDNVSIIETTCNNNEDGLNISVSSKGITKNTVIKKSDLRQSKLQELSSLFVMVSDEAENDIVLFKIYYNNDKIHLYEYNMILDSFHMAQKKQAKAWLIQEISDETAETND